MSLKVLNVACTDLKQKEFVSHLIHQRISLVPF